MTPTETPLLSICISTRNRAADIVATLEILLPQCPPDQVEVVVVDGASTDATPALLQDLAQHSPALRFFPQAQNSGIDGDFDKSITLARGIYCWLMSDDDWPTSDGVAIVLAACQRGACAVITDAEVWSADFSDLLHQGRMPFSGERRFLPSQQSLLLRDCGDTLSFIGALTIHRELWLARDRHSYYGTEFVHVGVMFQAALPGDVIAIAKPTLRLRYGVGNWVTRSFEVWMHKWPVLIWSFPHLSDDAKRAVVWRFPWRQAFLLLTFRSRAWYGWSDFQRIIWPTKSPWPTKVVPAVIALLPGWLVVMAATALLKLRPDRHPGLERDLAASPWAWWKRRT